MLDSNTPLVYSLKKMFFKTFKMPSDVSVGLVEPLYDKT